MGLITASNSNEFKSASYIYSKVRRFLKSFDAANLIDEGEFPIYTKEVLKSFGQGAYKESQALLYMKDGKASLPEDFEYLYSAYKCSLQNQFKGVRKHLQPSSFGFSMNITNQIVEKNGCEISCCQENTEVIQTIDIKNYVIEGKSGNYKFNNVIPLRLSPNVSKDLCIDGMNNFLNTSPYEITINNGVLSSNFYDDFIYIKYYAFPIDDEGNILVPNVESIEKSIEWYIIFQFLLSGWFNSSIPDIQNKAQYAEMQYEKYYALAKYIIKLPSFAEMVNQIRTRRGLNKMVYITNQYLNTNFQRS